MAEFRKFYHVISDILYDILRVFFGGDLSAAAVWGHFAHFLGQALSILLEIHFLSLSQNFVITNFPE